MGLPPRPRPSRALTTIAPAPARGPWGRASMVLFDEEGAPSPPPPRVISPRSDAWGDAGEEYNRGCSPGPAFPEAITCTAPAPGRGRSAKRGRGGGDRRAVYGASSPATPFPGSHHDSPRSCAGALRKGQYGSLRRGGGSLPGPSPGDTLTVRCMRRCRQRTRSGPAPRTGFPGLSPALPPPLGGGGAPEARAGWGR